MSLDDLTRVPPYFIYKELACKCGCGLLPPFETIMKAYSMRLILDIPLLINSAARCAKYNRFKQFSPNSAHVPFKDRISKTLVVGGGGLDIVAESRKKHMIHEVRLIEVAIFVGFTGIGLRDNTFLHVDDCTGIKRPSAFGYN